MDPVFSTYASPVPFIVKAFDGTEISGRFLKRNQTLWGGFIIEIKDKRIYYTGDGGYGKHFAEIAERFPEGMDFVMLENGQYDKSWYDVHMFSEEALDAAAIVKARNVIPVHAGKFNLCKSPWNMPYERILKYYEENKNNPQYRFKLLFPKLGEVVNIPSEQKFEYWWKNS